MYPRGGAVGEASRKRVSEASLCRSAKSGPLNVAGSIRYLRRNFFSLGVYYHIANPREGKRKYVKNSSPQKRRRMCSTDRVVRQDAGHHRFDKRPHGETKKKEYKCLVHKWTSANCATPPSTWIEAARMCKGDLLMGKGKAISASCGEFAFLLLDSQKPKPGRNGGGDVVYSCKSHRSTDNFKCRAAWKFRVDLSESSSYEVSVYSPVNNEHEVYETDEYAWSKCAARTRHFASEAMKMGDAASVPSKVDQLAVGFGGSERQNTYTILRCYPTESGRTSLQTLATHTVTFT